MKAQKLIGVLEKKLKVNTKKELAETLGLSPQTINNWRNGRKLTEHQIAGTIAKSCQAAIKHSHCNAIKPIVEFFQLEAVDSYHGVKFELFQTRGNANNTYKQLKKLLSTSKGIYIFYDSRGRALYAGKAKRQNLWTEMKSVFNRERETQKVFRVNHPKNSQNFLPSHEKNRQPRKEQILLSGLAAYFSAYQIEEGLIDDLEALLVRGFANDLLNKRMETFVRTKNDRNGQ